jgi:hypothetical protein
MSTWHISYSRDVLFSGCNYNCTTALPSSNYVTLLPVWKIDEDIPISNAKANSCVDADYKRLLIMLELHCAGHDSYVPLYKSKSSPICGILPCRSSTKSRISTFTCHVRIFSCCFIHLPFFTIYLVTVLSAEMSCLLSLQLDADPDVPFDSSKYLRRVQAEKDPGGIWEPLCKGVSPLTVKPKVSVWLMITKGVYWCNVYSGNRFFEVQSTHPR